MTLQFPADSNELDASCTGVDVLGIVDAAVLRWEHTDDKNVLGVLALMHAGSGNVIASRLSARKCYIAVVVTAIVSVTRDMLVTVIVATFVVLALW